MYLGRSKKEISQSVGNYISGLGAQIRKELEERKISFREAKEQMHLAFSQEEENFHDREVYYEYLEKEEAEKINSDSEEVPLGKDKKNVRNIVPIEKLNHLPLYGHNREACLEWADDTKNLPFILALYHGIRQMGPIPEFRASPFYDYINHIMMSLCRNEIFHLFAGIGKSKIPMVNLKPITIYQEFTPAGRPYKKDKYAPFSIRNFVFHFIRRGLEFSVEQEIRMPQEEMNIVDIKDTLGAIKEIDNDDILLDIWSRYKRDISFYYKGGDRARPDVFNIRPLPSMEKVLARKCGVKYMKDVLSYLEKHQYRTLEDALQERLNYYYGKKYARDIQQSL